MDSPDQSNSSTAETVQQDGVAYASGDPSDVDDLSDLTGQGGPDTIVSLVEFALGALETGNAALNASEDSQEALYLESPALPGVNGMPGASLIEDEGGSGPETTSIGGSFAPASASTVPALDAAGQVALARTETGLMTGLDRRGSVLSDEQDFDAVAGRETIESDSLRRLYQQMEFVAFQPTDLPERQGSANVAEYALSVPHEVGTRVFPRQRFLFSRSRFDRRCAAYADGHAAQVAFLDAGGPARDRLGLDPDGDGFACGWSPVPYRRML